MELCVQSIKSSTELPKTETEETINITPERFEAFLRTCVGVRDYFWEYVPKSFLQKDKSGNPIYLSDKIIKEHLLGKKTLGLSPFVDNDIKSRSVYFLGLDIDAHGLTDGAKEELLKKYNGNEEKVNKINDLEKEKQKLMVEEQYERITAFLTQEGYTYFVNTSGSAGRHIRIYFCAPVDARIGRVWLKYVFGEKLKLDVPEIFPKQDDRMDTEEHRGNQMKAVCAVHPKTKRRANILRADGSVMSVNETLDFLIEFAKKLPNAKPLDFELTQEREEKYAKDKKATKEQYKEQPIPQYCEFIETIAAKNLLISDGKFNRHDYLDGAVFRYCEKNNKPEVKEEYMKMQGRDKGAFNGADDYHFSCKAIKNYIKNFPEHEVLRTCQGMCESCKYTQTYTEELSLRDSALRKFDNILKGKDSGELKVNERDLRVDAPDFQKIIEKITDAKDDAEVERIFTEWATGKKKVAQRVIFTILQGAKQARKKTIEKPESLLAGLVLEKGTNGSITITYNEVREDHYGNQYIEPIPLLFFTEVSIKNANHYNALLNMLSKKMIVTLKQGSETKIEYSIEDVGNWAALSVDILSKFAPMSSYKSILPEHTEAVADYLRDKLPEKMKDTIKDIETTDMFGVFLINGKLKVYHTDNCELHSKDYTDEELADVIDEETRIRNVPDDLLTISTWLNNVKQIPQTDYARRVMYNYWAFGLSSYLRVALWDLGVGLCPSTMLVGWKGEGKTQLYGRTFITSFYGMTTEQNSQVFEGTGIRLKFVGISTSRPQIVDEIKSFGENKKMHDVYKNTATARLGAELKRGTKEGNMTRFYVSRSFFCGANKINVDDTALRDRIYGVPVLKGLQKENKHLNEQELISLHTNAISVCRFFQNYLENNGDTILENIRKIFDDTQALAKENMRDAAVERYLRTGLFLIKELYLKAGVTPPELDDIKVFAKSDVEMITDNDSETAQAIIWKIMRERHRFTRTELVVTGNASFEKDVWDDMSTYEVLQIYKDTEKGTPEYQKCVKMYGKLAANGIYFSAGAKQDVLLTGNGFKSKYNEISKVPIGSIKELADILKNCGWDVRYLDKDEKITTTDNKRVVFAIAISREVFKNANNDEKQGTFG